MTTRYEVAALRVAEEIEQRNPGVSIVVCSRTEQAVVAEAVAAALGWPAPVELAAVVEGGGQWVLRGLPADDAVLDRLNGSRDRLTLLGSKLVLPLSHDEWKRFLRLCGDVYATVSLVRDMPFEADGTVSVEAGRAELAARYERRYGRLDLRGLIRRSEEDVGWPIEALYQPLRARSVWEVGEDGALVLAGLVEVMEGDEVAPKSGEVASGERARLDPAVPLAEQLDAGWHDKPLVLLGGPGSGKSFFLRWCARSGVAGSLFGIEAPLPVLVPLAAFAAAPLEQSFIGWVYDWLLIESPAAAHALPDAMKAGRAVFLLDGLDEAGSGHGRKRCAKAVAALGEEAPGCPVVVTSRPAGFGEGLLSEARVAQVEAFDGEEIGQFLECWGRQYAVDARGAAAAEDGAAEGRALAAEIEKRPAIRTLAETPLLLTVLALVHRMGVRLPENRVELYGQITVVLVERWNRVRSLSGGGRASPLRVGDAVRLLGPLAWEMVERGERGSISETRLVEHIERVLAQGVVRGFESAAELVEVFRASLGLLVEQAPGRYAFSHSTLVEYFAARELVRGRGLERLIESGNVFEGGYREVVRLALGELSHVRLDDERVNNGINAIARTAESDISHRTQDIIALLGAIIEDDLPLADVILARVVETLTKCLDHRRKFSVTQFIGWLPLCFRWWREPSKRWRMRSWNLLREKLREPTRQVFAVGDISDASIVIASALRQLFGIANSDLSESGKQMYQMGARAWQALLRQIDSTLPD